MRNDRGGSLRQTTIRKVVLSRAGVATCLAFTCLCLVCGCIAVFTADWIEETEYPTLVDTTVTIDTSALPEKPTEDDWYPIALQVLEDNGWELPPNLVMLSSGIPCSPPAALQRLHLDFAATDLVGLIPHRKSASMYLDRTTSTAAVFIYDAGPGFALSHNLEFSEMTVGSREALEIADAHGGEELRKQMGDDCEVSIWIRKHTWEIHYHRVSEQPARPLLHIEIDARSGKIKRVSR